LPQVDFFNFFRFVLMIIVSVYVTVVTLQSMRDWKAWLTGSDRYISMLRRYLVVHGLRLRFRAFWGDVLICLLLCVALILIWKAQRIIDVIGVTLADAR
jgi:hypothetical protein